MSGYVIHLMVIYPVEKNNAGFRNKCVLRWKLGLGKASLKWHLSVLSGYQLPCLDGQDAGVADAEWDVEVGR